MYRSTIIAVSMLVAAMAANSASVDETVANSLSYHPALSAAQKEQTVAEYQIEEAKSG